MSPLDRSATFAYRFQLCGIVQVHRPFYPGAAFAQVHWPLQFAKFPIVAQHYETAPKHRAVHPIRGTFAMILIWDLRASPLSKVCHLIEQKYHDSALKTDDYSLSATPFCNISRCFSSTRSSRIILSSGSFVYAKCSGRSAPLLARATKYTPSACARSSNSVGM